MCSADGEKAASKPLRALPKSYYNTLTYGGSAYGPPPLASAYTQTHWNKPLHIHMAISCLRLHTKSGSKLPTFLSRPCCSVKLSCIPAGPHRTTEATSASTYTSHSGPTLLFLTEAESVTEKIWLKATSLYYFQPAEQRGGLSHQMVATRSTKTELYFTGSFVWEALNLLFFIFSWNTKRIP